jgi:polyphosphate kinase
MPHYRQTVIPRLAKHGVFLRRWDELTPDQHKEACAYFDNNLSAALTPLVIDPEHPFPFLSNLSTSLIFTARSGPRYFDLCSRKSSIRAEAVGSANRRT